jgi:hypothetical protein
MAVSEVSMSVVVTMSERKRIALVAHDNRKTDLLQWARYNRESLARHDLFATGTTGGMIADELGRIRPTVTICCAHGACDELRA